MIYIILQHIFLNGYKNVHPGPDRSLNNLPPGSGSVPQDYGSADPDPKEIFTDQQHGRKHNMSSQRNLKTIDSARMHEFM
jgi:hypothetical protein